MGEEHFSKAFATKFSLRKFVSVIKRLTPIQKDLVCSIGLGSLLHICCEYLPRSLILYLVSNFNTKTRTLRFSNQSTYTLSPSSIHKTLGTPIGGKHIGEKVDPALRLLISKLTNCEGHYPTINELDKLITPALDGDDFKIVFTLFAMTAFLCPSSYDAVSPFYLHIVKNSKEIGDFDFSTAILDKLVSCLEAFKEGLTCVLGGNLLSLLAIYFEFLDCDLIPAPSKSLLPRIYVWSTTLVQEIEMLDSICMKTSQYGRLPIKDFSFTSYGFSQKHAQFRVGKSQEDLLNLFLSVSPEHHHSLVKEQLPLIMSNMYKEIVESIEPVVIDSVMSLVSLISRKQSVAVTNNSCTIKEKKLQ